MILNEMDILVKKSGQLGLHPFYHELTRLIDDLKKKLAAPDTNGRVFQTGMQALFDRATRHRVLTEPVVRIGTKDELTDAQYRNLNDFLHALMPWRKGPFSLFGIDIDSEWRSDLKWERVRPHLRSLQGRKILDIGSSNGYYLFRMAAEKPFISIGIEPSMPFYHQYLVLQRFAQVERIVTLPVTLEAFPVLTGYFDTIFCMGILYHRRSPVDTLKQMQVQLRKNGELVLETLIVEGNSEIALFPADRYAKMRNIYFLPTVSCLTNWLKRAGFTRVRCVDVTPTTAREQRKTDWIQTESLDDFLDPADNTKTVEGYPAPVRAVLVAEAG
ncbi:MAG: tRNA 5-methoxyuridine(34)/uridine 5-oxyacetic acid(34) synthase CmoB [Deltaproteobacteria bacterium]|nr:MAG: tRNA 5-methoxyuridine(34)/uridine 5-oxyacetic acid(34) synthase CmoB [Deltaproteobacteria bacterium]